MKIHSIKTHRIEENESIFEILDRYVVSLAENSVLAITSKILSLTQGRTVDKSRVDKYELIRQEADAILETNHNPYGFHLTLKNGILIPSAGIDESNVDNVYVLYPENIQLAAAEIWQHLRAKHKIQNLGILITDSHTTIMRRGVTGIALGWCGFEPLYSYIGKSDLYENPLRVTQLNIIDALATSAVFVMGEGNEQTPLAILSEIPKIKFSDHVPTPEEEMSISISMEDDLYAPLLQSAKWVKIQP